MSVAVVIPAYNAEAFIHKAIDSVLGQTTPVNEIIVVDDGSKDNTRAVVESYGDRVRLITQANQGPSVARNLGVEIATSNLIAFLDADDAWDLRKNEKQLAVFRTAPGTVLCYTGLLKLFPDGSQTVSRASPVESLPSSIRLGNPSIVPSCVMLSRSAFLQSGGYTSLLKGSEDWDLWLRFIKLGPFRAVDEPLTFYQVSNTGLSSNAEHMFNEAKSMMEDRLLAGLHGFNRTLWRRRILSFQSYKAALTARASAQKSKQLGYILDSFVYWPFPFWQPYRFKVLAITIKNKIAPGKQV